MRRLTCLAAAMVTALAASPANAAPRAPLACGNTITRDTTLHADLSGCTGDGLIIGADGITLDLAGHTIAANDSGGAGIRIAGRARVIVKDGTVTGFFRGVELTGARHGAIRRVRAVHNAERAIVLADRSDHNLLADDDASANGRSGIVLLDSSDNVLTHNRTADNESAGIGGLGADRNRLVGNVVADNHDVGIFWAGGSGNRLAGNHVTGMPFQGMALDFDDGVIAGNRLAGNGDALALTGSRNRVTRNIVADTGGCPEGCGFGLSLEGGAHNEVDHNVVARSARDGIRLDAFVPEDAPLASDTVIRANVVLDSAFDGISVGTETGNPIVGTVIDRNVVLRSGDDGIDVDRASSRLSRNLAIGSADIGIDAIGGVSDGGGNRAFASGGEAQCRGVSCG